MMAKSTFRRIGSLFFLGIFLWFYAVKDIHDVVHGDDVHCHVLNAHHFHTQEHHCPVCDFQLPGFDDQSPPIKVSSHNFFIKVQSAVLAQAISSEPFSLFSSRAPPVVA
jgi:hypothetical protein